jgi:hypothetical protein
MVETSRWLGRFLGRLFGALCAMMTQHRGREKRQARFRRAAGECSPRPFEPDVEQAALPLY